VLLVGLRVLVVLLQAHVLLISIQHHQLLSKLLVLHAQLLPDLNQASQTVNIVRVLLIDILIDLQSLIKQVHASIARSDHEGPLVLLGLTLLSTFEVNNCLFKLIVLCVVHAETRDHIDLGRVVAIGLLVEVNSLELVLLLLVEVAHLRQNFRVARHFRDEDIVPLEGLATRLN